MTAAESRRAAPAGPASPGAPTVIAVLAPTGRDAAVAERVLGRAGLATAACADMRALCALVDTGDLGAVLVGEEALDGAAARMLIDALDRQPTWSDVPLVVLTGEDELSRAIPPELDGLAARANVTLLERPVRVATIVTVLRSALRARQRQRDVRDHLEERARLLEGERTARREAEEANRAKADFLASMSHELRTPLNAIGGYAQLLDLEIHGPMTAEQREHIRRIERSQRHLLSLINDVLNFAKLEAGSVQLTIAPVAVGELLLGVEALVLPLIRAKGLHYALDEAGLAHACVRADEEKARQVLVNLLSNAVKFTDAGGEVRVACEADASWVRIVVTDTGVGIPADRLESVFEPFVQLNRGLTTSHEGTGLGLAISRDLARRMGGDVSVTSDIGRGSRFAFALPRA